MDKSCFIKIVEAGLTCKDCVYFNRDSTGYLQCNNLQYIEVEEDFLCNKFETKEEPDFYTNTVHEFIGWLNGGGAVDMKNAAPYHLAEECELTVEEARIALVYWMEKYK